MRASGMAETMDDVAEEQGRMEGPSIEETGSASEANPNGSHDGFEEKDAAVPLEISSQAPSISEIRALTGILEALLFMVADPLPINRIMALLGAVPKHEIEQALTRLKEDYAQEGRGLHLAEIAGGYRIVTKPDYAPWIKRLDKVKPPAKLSRSALESLAIIAYKQPIVRAEIEQIRGVETSGVLRTLLERKLVRIVGRKEEPGRPIMYGTTKFFLEHFGLRDLSQLPPLREFKELGESEQATLPMEEEQGPEEAPSLLGIDASEERTDDGEDIAADSERTDSVLEESVHPG
jgi:segregation and condensation protein B